MNNPIEFSLTNEQFTFLKDKYPNMRSNHDIANFGVSVVKLYLESRGYTDIQIEKDKIDIQGKLNNEVVKFEVKSTVDTNISFDKLKVSSLKDYRLLVEDGMEIIRVCKVGKQTLDIYFLKYDKDFILKEEPRWRLVRKK